MPCQDNIVKFAEPGAFEDPLTEVFPFRLMDGIIPAALRTLW
jgi:hypothetical protein